MDVKALQLTSRFALPPSTLGHCRKDTAPSKLEACILEGKCAGVEKELEKFPSLHPFLKTISEIAGLPKFSYDVVEAYWIGNDLLRKVKAGDYNILLRNFAGQGVPNFLIKELKRKPPKEFIPTHLFKVLFIDTASAPSITIEQSNNCMVRWGKVEKLVGNATEVILNSIRKETNKYTLILNRETLQYNPKFLPKLKVGDSIVVHWNQIIKAINGREEELLSKYTKNALKSF
jgi:hypothetical protein